MAISKIGDFSFRRTSLVMVFLVFSFGRCFGIVQVASLALLGPLRALFAAIRGPSRGHLRASWAVLGGCLEICSRILGEGDTAAKMRGR